MVKLVLCTVGTNNEEFNIGLPLILEMESPPAERHSQMFDVGHSLKSSITTSTSWPSVYTWERKAHRVNENPAFGIT
jgi:hypothetical protein